MSDDDLDDLASDLAGMVGLLGYDASAAMEAACQLHLTMGGAAHIVRQQGEPRREWLVVDGVPVFGVRWFTEGLTIGWEPMTPDELAALPDTEAR